MCAVLFSSRIIYAIRAGQKPRKPRGESNLLYTWLYYEAFQNFWKKTSIQCGFIVKNLIFRKSSRPDRLKIKKINGMSYYLIIAAFGVRCGRVISSFFTCPCEMIQLVLFLLQRRYEGHGWRVNHSDSQTPQGMWDRHVPFRNKKFILVEIYKIRNQ
jgi:hypothetical protein